MGTPPNCPHSPSVLVSKHIPSVKKSPIQARKQSLIFSICSDPPRHYNEFFVEPDAPHPLRGTAQLFSCSPSVRSSKGTLERVMNLGEKRIGMRIPRSPWFPCDLRFPHS